MPSSTPELTEDWKAFDALRKAGDDPRVTLHQGHAGERVRISKTGRKIRVRPYQTRSEHLKGHVTASPPARFLKRQGHTIHQARKLMKNPKVKKSTKVELGAAIAGLASTPATAIIPGDELMWAAMLGHALNKARREAGIKTKEKGPLAGRVARAVGIGPTLMRPAFEADIEESIKTAALSVTHAPIGKGGKNWITATKPGNKGQLPAYIQNIRNAIMRGGKDESSATAIAIGRVKAWARGGGNVSKEVRAAAAKAVAEWEALKGISKAKRAVKVAVKEGELLEAPRFHVVSDPEGGHKVRDRRRHTDVAHHDLRSDAVNHARRMNRWGSHRPPRLAGVREAALREDISIKGYVRHGRGGRIIRVKASNRKGNARRLSTAGLRDVASHPDTPGIQQVQAGGGKLTREHMRNFGPDGGLRNVERMGAGKLAKILGEQPVNKEESTLQRRAQEEVKRRGGLVGAPAGGGSRARPRITVKGGATSPSPRASAPRSSGNQAAPPSFVPAHHQDVWDSTLSALERNGGLDDSGNPHNYAAATQIYKAKLRKKAPNDPWLKGRDAAGTTRAPKKAVRAPKVVVTPRAGTGPDEASPLFDHKAAIDRLYADGTTAKAKHGILDAFHSRPDDELRGVDEGDLKDLADAADNMGAARHKALAQRIDGILAPPKAPKKAAPKKAVKPAKRTPTELITHADGSTTIQAADPNPPSPGPNAPVARSVYGYDVTPDDVKNRFGGHKIGDKVIRYSPSGVKQSSEAEEVVGYGRNGDLVVKEPKHGTTVHSNHKYLKRVRKRQRESFAEAKRGWGPKARAAALAARRAHLKQHGGYKPEHLDQMSWDEMMDHARAAHHEGDVKTVGMAKKYMDKNGDAWDPGATPAHREEMAELHATVKAPEAAAKPAAKPKTVRTRKEVRATVGLPPLRRPPASADAKASVNDAEEVRKATEAVQDKYVGGSVHRRLSGGTNTLKLDNARREIPRMSAGELHLARAYARQRGAKKHDSIWNAVHSHATLALDDMDRKQRKGSGFYRGQRLSDHIHTLSALRSHTREDALASLSKEQLADLKTYHDVSAGASSGAAAHAGYHERSSAEVAKAMKGGSRAKRAAPAAAPPDPSQYIKLADHPNLRVSLQRGKVVHAKGLNGPHEVLRASGSDLYVKPFEPTSRAVIRTSYEDVVDYHGGTKIRAADVTHIKGRIRQRRSRYRY